uniref:Uncharacterized protein n=1 Tax=Octopus bimaculoides TaxID=37653 RepID=A0A0L8G7J3_OCTBM
MSFFVMFVFELMYFINSVFVVSIAVSIVFGMLLLVSIVLELEVFSGVVNLPALLVFAFDLFFPPFPPSFSGYLPFLTTFVFRRNI